MTTPNLSNASVSQKGKNPKYKQNNAPFNAVPEIHQYDKEDRMLGTSLKLE